MVLYPFVFVPGWFYEDFVKLFKDVWSGLMTHPEEIKTLDACYTFLHKFKFSKSTF